jgi:FkbM family methyltransferase
MRISEIVRATMAKAPIVENGDWVKNVYYQLHPPARLSVGQADARAKIESHSDVRYVNHFRRKEKSRVSQLLSSLNPNDIFYDIGAYHGLYTCIIADTLPDEHIIAFEPNPKNHTKLDQNLEINDISPRTYQVCLSNDNGSIPFELNESQSSVQPDQVENQYKCDTHKCIDLIESKNLPTPNVVKMDVEGFELEVLEGMGNIISEVDQFFIEFHYPSMQKYGSEPESIIKILKQNGFNIEFSLSDNTETPQLKPDFSKVSLITAKQA